MNHASVVSSVTANSVTTALLLTCVSIYTGHSPGSGIVVPGYVLIHCHIHTFPNALPKEGVLIYFPTQNVWPCLTHVKNCHTCDRRYYQSVVRGLEVQGKELEDAEMVLLKRGKIKRLQC